MQVHGGQRNFFEKLATKRKVAIRRGELAENQAEYILKANALDDFCMEYEQYKT